MGHHPRAKRFHHSRFRPSTSDRADQRRLRAEAHRAVNARCARDYRRGQISMIYSEVVLFHVLLPRMSLRRPMMSNTKASPEPVKKQELRADHFSKKERKGSFLLDDFPVILPPFDDKWGVWPGVDPQTDIPLNAKPHFSGIWLFPAPNSFDTIRLDLYGANIRIWRWIGVARNGFGSPGRPEGPFGPCRKDEECPIGWSNFSNPYSEAVGPGQVLAHVNFGQSSHDYPRFAYWIALASID